MARPSSRAIASVAAAPTSCATGRSSRRTARPRRPIVDVARVPITIGGLARHNVANALAAAGGARGLGATIAQVRDGLHLVRADRRALAGPAQPVPGRVAGRDRRLRPQRGRRRGGPRRRRGDRRRGGRAGGADHRDHRHGRRPAGRHAARHRADRRRTGAAGGDQADAQLPARPDRRIGRRRAARRGRGRRRRPGGRPDLRLRDRGAQGGAQRGGRAVERRPGGFGAGHRADVPRGPRRRLRAAQAPRRAAGRRRLRADRAGPTPPGPAPRAA